MATRKASAPTGGGAEPYPGAPRSVALPALPPHDSPDDHDASRGRNTSTPRKIACIWLFVSRTRGGTGIAGPNLGTVILADEPADHGRAQVAVRHVGEKGVAGEIRIAHDHDAGTACAGGTPLGPPSFHRDGQHARARPAVPADPSGAPWPPGGSCDPRAGAPPPGARSRRSSLCCCVRAGSPSLPAPGTSRLRGRTPGKKVSAIRDVIGCGSYTGTATDSGSVE